ncbi:MAG: hypothetical protein WCX27_00140 [Candidatus Paceibacterota bacterium]|jgi:cytidine deaminase
MQNHAKTLKEALDLCVSKKKEGKKTSSIAISEKGNSYIAGSVDSDTHLLNISSEQASLALASASRDYKINKVITLVEDSVSVLPQTVEIMIDHYKRTGVPISYEVIDSEGKTLLSVKDVTELSKYYDPKMNILSMTNDSEVSKNKIAVKVRDEEDKTRTLKKYAIEGVTRNFPTSDKASGYGTAVLTKNGTLYFAGQYSTPDKRLGLHSEMCAMLSAMMDGNAEMTDIALVSTKYADEPCNMCGICRQFIAEISAKFNLNPNIHCFSMDSEKMDKHSISEYLPNSWSSKNWK